MENTDILIREITRKSEIVDKCTWILAGDGGQNVLVLRGTRDVATALSEGRKCYYVSPDVFEGDFHFDGVAFADKPKGLSVDVTFTLQLLPEMPGFADWVKLNIIQKASRDDLVKILASPKYGLKLFLQHWLEGVTNFDLLKKHGKESVPAFAGQDSSLESWVYVVGMNWIQADDVSATERKRINDFSAIQAEYAFELKLRREKCIFETQRLKLADALKVASSQSRLLELQHESDAKRVEAEIERLKAEKAEAELRLLRIEREKGALSEAGASRLRTLESVIGRYDDELQRREERIHVLESLISELHGEIEKLSKGFSERDWYDELPLWKKFFAYLRFVFAYGLMVVPWHFAHSEGGRYVKPDIYFCMAGLYSGALIIIGWRRILSIVLAVKKICSGGVEIDLKYFVVETLRLMLGGMFCAFSFCFLLNSGLYLIHAIGFDIRVLGFDVWGLEFVQKVNMIGLKPKVSECVAMFGIWMGVFRFSSLLLMGRRIRCSKKHAFKWILICLIPFVAGLTNEKKYKKFSNRHDLTSLFVQKFQDKEYDAAIALVANVDKNNLKVQALLGDAYLMGKGVDVDYKEAVRWYKKAVEKLEDTKVIGTCDYNIGFCYYQMTNYVESVKWFSRAAELGEVKAHLFMGKYYEIGVGGCEKNSTQALLHYDKAKASNNVAVQDEAQLGIDRINKSNRE